jgi:hypothetical protein
MILDYAPVREREPVQSRWGGAAVWCAVGGMVAGWALGVVAAMGNPPLPPDQSKVLVTSLRVMTVAAWTAGIVSGYLGWVQKRRLQHMAFFGMCACLFLMGVVIVVMVTR